MNLNQKRPWGGWIIVGLGIIVAVGQGLGVWRLWRAGAIVDEVQTRVREAQEKNEQLKKRLAQVDSPEFIEREARDKLGYAREGETVLIVPAVPEASPLPAVDNEPNWRKWWKLYVRD